MADVHIYAPLCVAAGAVFPPICAILVGLRFYARKKQRVSTGLDDWLTLPAFILVIGMCVATLTGVGTHAVGYKTPPLPPGKTILTTSSRQQSLTRSIYWAIELMQVPALAAIKMSLVFFYRRVFNQGASQWFRILTATVLTIIAIWATSFFFTFLFMCPGHPDVYWSTLARQKKICVDTAIVHNSYGISDVIIDIFVILLPIPLVVRLQMSASRKMAVLAIFALGAFSIIASIIRMVIYLESTAAEFKSGTDTDILITGGIYWSLVECGTGLMSACLPTVTNLWRAKLVHSFKHSQGRLGSNSLKKIVKPSTWRMHGYRAQDGNGYSDIELEAFRQHATADVVSERAGGQEPAEDQIFVHRAIEAVHSLKR